MTAAYCPLSGRYQEKSGREAEIARRPALTQTRQCRAKSTRRRNRDHVVPGRPDQIVNHLAVGRASEADDRRHVVRVALDQNDVRRLDGDIRSSADRDADIGLSERGRIVDAVASGRRASSISGMSAVALARQTPSLALPVGIALLAKSSPRVG